MSTKAYVVLTTVASVDDARKLARALVESERAACVTVLAEARSTYRWEGKLVEEPECLLVIKAPRRAGPAPRAAILQQQPHEGPGPRGRRGDGGTGEDAARPRA